MSIPLPSSTSPFQSFMQGMGSVQGYRQKQEDLQFSQLKNQLFKLQNQYAPETIQADLEKEKLGNISQQLQNQYYAPLAQSQMASAASARALQGTEAAKNRFMVQNPLFMTSGVGNQLGAMAYIGTHPELANILFPGSTQQQPTQDVPQFQQPSPIPIENNLLSSQPQTQGMGGLPSGASQGLERLPPPVSTIPTNALQTSGTDDIPKMSNNPWVNSLLQQPILQAQAQKSRSNYYDAMVRTLPWRGTPIDQRNAQVAAAAGAGVDPSVSVPYFQNGGKLRDLYTSRGYDPNNPPQLLYGATTKSISAIQTRNQADAEMKLLGDRQAKGLAPYAQRFMGYSLPQITDAIKGDNPQRQIDFIASKMEIPVINMIRQRQSGSAVTATEVEGMKKEQEAQFKILGLTLTPEVYAGALKRFNQDLTDAAEAANKSLRAQLTPEELVADKLASQQGRKQPGMQPELQSFNVENMVSITTPDGQVGTISQSNLAEFQKKFPGTKVNQ